MSVDFVEGIEYLNRYIGDTSIYVLGKMVKYYESSDINSLKKIIFCGLDNNQINHLIENNNSNNNHVVFDDHISKRIWVDIDLYTVINLIFKLTKNILPKKNLSDIIIYEWLYKELEKSKKGYDMNIDPYNSKYVIDESNMKYLFLNIRDDLWNNFIRIAKTRNLNLDQAFKIATINFLENRHAYLESGNEIKIIDTDSIDQIKFDNKFKHLIVENLIIEKREIKDIQEICGVFLYQTRSKKTYIGSSINIKNYLIKNLMPKYYDIIESIYIYRTEDIFGAIELEKEMTKNFM